ncbi:septum formation family protein [Citricoccus muralis]|uniref:Septum formation family protein n=1 Tax=Citricoccus muralis TaxID=169134 RepID=A0ABY8H5V1_9MICC|nr:septum formation family protein [Citricoccus muralis]WFP16033.1 septum formation family protein [Citricoccus muralis]
MTQPPDENVEGPAETTPEDPFTVSDEAPQTSVLADTERKKSRRDVRRRRQNRNRWLTTGALLVVIVVIGLVVVPWVSSMLNSDSNEETPTATERNENPGLDGIIATGLPPEDFEPGDCLTDFTSTQDPATVIECDQPHEAELVGRQTFADADAYPGTDQMRAAAEEFCGSIQLTGTADAPVVIQVTNPSEGSWGEGDRRVDCLATTTEGQLTGTLVENPVVDNTGSASGEESPETDAEADTDEG